MKPLIVAGVIAISPVLVLPLALAAGQAAPPAEASADCAPAPTEGRYTQQAIADLWLAQGGPPGDVDGDGIPEPQTAGAVGMAESAGDPSVVNPIGAGGLMQIHPPELDYLDPVVNMRIAIRKWRAQGWDPWEAYTGPDGQGSDGPWRDHLEPVQLEARSVGCQGLGPGDHLWPVPGAVLTSSYGPRGGRQHEGIDLGAPVGAPIVAINAGVVVLRQVMDGYGEFTCVRHAEALTSCYAHQSEALVNDGERVERGQRIGLVGCTGRCFGPHLHFEIHRAPSWSNHQRDVDPLPLLPAGPGAVVS